MGTQVVYLGPDAFGVEISDSGQFAERGKPIEVETELAERLLEQETTWARPTSKAAKEAAKATPPRTPEEET